MMKLVSFSLVMLFVLTATVCNAREAEPYFNSSELPQLTYWYPQPPEITSTDFSYDVMQYIWGKIQRNDPVVAQQAVWDASYGMYVVTRRFSTAFGAPITEDGSPALYELLTDCFYTVNNVCSYPKIRYKRTRPYVMFQEATLVPGHETSYAADGSYPSTHAAMGWLMALLLAEVNPQAQDELLAIGYDFGQNRVISGFHWQSDVDAGRMAASSMFARLHADARFLEQMWMAKQEFSQRTGYSYTGISNSAVFLQPEDMPSVLSFLPAPPDTTAMAFVRDVNHYFEGRAKRDAASVESLSDYATHVDVLAARFEPYFGVVITPEKLPDVYALLEKTIATTMSMCARTQAQLPRKNPFEQFGEHLDADGTARRKSYPADEALAAWSVALVLLEINPQAQNQLLRCAYNYGEEAVLAGWRWQSDVDAAWLAATAAYARLHACDVFSECLEKARRQFVDNKWAVPHHLIIDEEPEGVIDNANCGSSQLKSSREGRYCIDGTPAGKYSQGIIISRGRKVLEENR